MYYHISTQCNKYPSLYDFFKIQIVLFPHSLYNSLIALGTKNGGNSPSMDLVPGNPMHAILIIQNAKSYFDSMHFHMFFVWAVCISLLQMFCLRKQV